MPQRTPQLREDTQVKLGDFFGVVIEPEEWRNFIHGRHGISQQPTPDKQPCRQESFNLDAEMSAFAKGQRGLQHGRARGRLLAC